MTLQDITSKAKVLSAVEFASFLDANRIEYEILDCNLLDYNDDYFNIILNDYDDANILFVDGKYQE